jgi:rhodanese-related sulfurtransferase
MTTTSPLDHVNELVALPVSAATAHRRQRAGAVLVDIRPQVARHQGSIGGAVLTEATDIDDLFAPGSPTKSALADVNRDYVICATSGRRARPAAEHLARLGYRNVYYLAGGYPAWQQRHLVTRS